MIFVCYFLYGFHPSHTTNDIRLSCILYELWFHFQQKIPYFPYIFTKNPFILGRIKKSGSVTIDGTKYEINNCVVTKAYDKDSTTKANNTSLYTPWVYESNGVVYTQPLN